MNRGMRQFGILIGLILVLLLVLFVCSSQYKEDFVNSNVCADYDTCVSCANKSNCTWCSSSKKCLTKEEIGRNDSLCNQMNLVFTAPMCHVEPTKKAASLTVSNPNMEENPLYRGQIANKTAPPMVCLNEEMSYSPETIMADVRDLRSEVRNLMQRM